jgi:catechol 2,3-dioxygenase-like lactoylglutathione lyase family enzyme
MKTVKLRVARPTDDMEALRRFYVDGLGLLEKGSFRDHEGYDGELFGTDDVSYELEFTHHRDGSPCSCPSADNLLVFYVAGDEEVRAIERRMEAIGVLPVAPANPYWLGRGLTYEDPDGWRVVVFDAQTLAASSGTGP